jgi:predicted TIM-barrel fold metal-dependent hydrolase
MIIDAHNHPDWWYKDHDQIIADMDACHIDKTWLFTWECPEDEYDPDQRNLWNAGLGDRGAYPASFAQCLDYKRRSPDRFILGFAPDPRSPSAIDRLESAVALHHVRLCGEIKLRMMYDNPDAVELFHWCGAHSLPVTLHFDYPIDTHRKYPRRNWWYGGDMDTLESLLRKCPDTVFLGHAPGFWANISNDGKCFTDVYPKGKVVRDGRIVKLLRQYPNLYCDISAGSGRNAFERDREYALEFMDEFQDRILYARDHFGNEHQELLNSLGLPRETLEKIYWKNASALLGGDLS